MIILKRFFISEKTLLVKILFLISLVVSVARLVFIVGVEISYKVRRIFGEWRVKVIESTFAL